MIKEILPTAETRGNQQLLGSSMEILKGLLCLFG
jgi:hypothetical protein